MMAAVLEIADKERFQSALATLRLTGAAAQGDMEVVAKEYGYEVADDMGHGDPNSIAKASIGLLENIPGISLSANVRSRQHTLTDTIASSHAVGVEINRSGDAFIDFTTNDLKRDPMTLSLQRKDTREGSYITVNLQIDDQGNVLGGSFGTQSESIDDPKLKGTRVAFDVHGKVTEFNDELIVLAPVLRGAQLNVPRILAAVTADQNLGQPKNIDTIVSQIFADIVSDAQSG